MIEISPLMFKGIRDTVTWHPTGGKQLNVISLFLLVPAGTLTRITQRSGVITLPGISISYAPVVEDIRMRQVRYMRQIILALEL
jgi:hypothetical protein